MIGVWTARQLNVARLLFWRKRCLSASSTIALNIQSHNANIGAARRQLIVILLSKESDGTNKQTNYLCREALENVKNANDADASAGHDAIHQFAIEMNTIK